MKKTFLLASLFLIFSCKNDSVKTEKSSPEVIKRDSDLVKTGRDAELNSEESIKKYYQILSSDLQKKKYDSLVLQFQCAELEGDVTYFSQGDDLKLIEFFNADSHAAVTENFFLKDGKPFFILKEENVWQFDGGTPEQAETKDFFTEQRFYIIDGKPIKCLEKKYEVRSQLKNNPKSESVQNVEMKNCSITDLQKDFEALMKRRNSKKTVECL